jgi:hypothetical protein
MHSIREAIEELAHRLIGCEQPIYSIGVELRAILSASSPSREELSPEEQLAGIIFNRDGEEIGRSMARKIMAALRADDLADATLPDMPTSKRTVVLNDSALTDSALYGSPSEEPLREALRKIIEWCDGTRGADFGKAPFEAIGDCARAALSRPAKPADLLYPPVLMTDEERYRNYLESLPSMQPPAKPPTPQSVTMTQPKIDFVLDLSQAEADRLGPPAPKVWRCETCGRIVDGDELCEPNLDYGEFHHLDIRGMPCGPVEEVKRADPS